LRVEHLATTTIIIIINMSSPQDAAHEFHQAISKKDHNALIFLVSKFENEPLQQVNAEYVKLYGKALSEAVKDAAIGEFGTLLIDLIIPRANFAARTIHNAVTGAGTDEHAVIDVVVHNSPQQIADLKIAYSNLFSRDLSERVASDLSGNFKKTVAALLDGKKRDAEGNPQLEAETLYKKGEGRWGTDDDYFVEFFTRHSFVSLQAINLAYESLYKHSLEEAIKKETSGDYESVLRAIVIPREVYWARRIRHAIAGLGTDDTLLRRAFSLNSKEQLRAISAVYESVNKGKQIRSDVADDTSGHYKALFLAILDSL